MRSEAALPPLHIVSGALPPHDPRRGAVMALGNFDGFHLGHLHLLHEASTLAKGRPLAVMSCEPHPVDFFRPQTPRRRLASPRQKARRAAELGLSYLWQPTFNADFAAQTPDAFFYDLLLGGLGISGLVVGEDFRFGKARAGNADWLRAACEASELDLAVVQKLPGCSSSLIREALRAGDLLRAAALLGQPWQAEVLCEGGKCWIEPSQILPPSGRCLLQRRSDGLKVEAEILPSGELLSLPLQHDKSETWAFVTYL